ncbi:MAG: alpha/beta fold hydrolase [Nitriliruptorales bacterium]|nr:alpha/beta fold hydrolase [Nitriliruptorales bacterium]
MTNTVQTEARRQVAAVQERLIGDAAVEVRSRFVGLDGGPRLQLLEAGDGDPVVILHASGNSAVAMLPLMEHLHGRCATVVDRPGYGLSGPIEGLREHPRRTGVDVVVRLLDALGIEHADLVGTSTGGFWSLWTALDHPTRVRRIVLVGATPLLPGTKPPLPLRLMTTPGIGSLLGRIMPEPSPKTVRQMMASMGEGDTSASTQG